MPRLNRLRRIGREVDRGWPGYLFGGHVRTSTLALVLVFLAVWWVYNTYRPSQPSSQTPTTQVVPPGFVPDPNYTWVPRSKVQQPPPTVTVTMTPTTTTPATTTPATTTQTTTTPPPPFPPFQLPVLPPPFGPGTTPPTNAPPAPSPTPAPLPGLPPVGR